MNDDLKSFFKKNNYIKNDFTFSEHWLELFGSSTSNDVKLIDPRDALLLDKEAQKLEPEWNFIHYEQHGKDRATAFIMMFTEIVYAFNPIINEFGKLIELSRSENLHF